MLREIPNVKQELGAGRRRWFESDNLDVIVWLGPSGAVDGFQLCYDLGRGAFAVTWRAGLGFAHDEIDEGDATPLKNESPVLRPAGAAPWREILTLFEARSGTLEDTLRALIRDNLRLEIARDAR